MVEGEFNRAIINEVTISNTIFESITFVKCIFQTSVFTPNVSFIDSVFEEGNVYNDCNFTGANFTNAEFLKKTKYTDCNLTDVKFINATLRMITFDNTNILNGIDFTNADIRHANFAQVGQFHNCNFLNVVFDFNTRFPDLSHMLNSRNISWLLEVHIQNQHPLMAPLRRPRSLYNRGLFTRYMGGVAKKLNRHTR